MNARLEEMKQQFTNIMSIIEKIPESAFIHNYNHSLNDTTSLRKIISLFTFHEICIADYLM
jgi:hypothetical protein